MVQLRVGPMPLQRCHLALHGVPLFTTVVQHGVLPGLRGLPLRFDPVHLLQHDLELRQLPAEAAGHEGEVLRDRPALRLRQRRVRLRGRRLGLFLSRR
jgi:hypothetical protein